MAKRPKAPKKPKAAANGEDPEAADIAATREAIAPLLEKGVNEYRLASACGAHVDDVRGFLEGRVSLTPAVRARLRNSVQSILDSFNPLRGGGE